MIELHLVPEHLLTVGPPERSHWVSKRFFGDFQESRAVGWKDGHRLYMVFIGSSSAWDRTSSRCCSPRMPCDDAELMCASSCGIPRSLFAERRSRAGSL